MSRPSRVFDVARVTGAVAYDIPGSELFSHEGELCSFDAFLKIYGIKDPTLDALAVIVRGADTSRPELAPQSAGLDRKSTRLNSSHRCISYAVFCLKKKNTKSMD